MCYIALFENIFASKICYIGSCFQRLFSFFGNLAKKYRLEAVPRKFSVTKNRGRNGFLPRKSVTLRN